MTYLQEIVQTAETFIGCTEGKTPNRGPAVDFFLAEIGYEVKPTQWCAVFVSFCALRTAKRLKLAANLKKSTGAVRLWQRNPAMQCSIPNLEPGCSFHRVREASKAAEARNGGDAPGHTGILYRHVGGNIWDTIEGNTVSGGENDNGGGCFVKRLDVTDPRIVGFLKPTAA